MTAQNVFIPKQGRVSNLSNWALGDLSTAVARLYSNNQPYTPDNLCGSYTECAFAGYAPVSPLGLGAVSINGTGKAESDTGAWVWNNMALVGTFPAFGIYVTDVALSQLYLVIPFLVPFIFTPTQTTLAYLMQLTETSEL